MRCGGGASVDGMKNPLFKKKGVFDGAQEKLLIDEAIMPKMGDRFKLF